MPVDQSAIFFKTPAEFRRWLHKNHATATELWMGLNKKHVVPRGLTWEQGVEEALCYGWIDSKAQRIDEDTIRQRWTPRKPGSNWSNINIALVEKLIAEGRMQPAGLAAYEKRSADRSGIYSYENRASLELPPEFSSRLRANPKASAFWEVATPSYRQGCVHWVLSAKQEATCEKRMNQLIDDSAAGRLIPPQRYGDTPAWVARAAAAAKSA